MSVSRLPRLRPRLLTVGLVLVIAALPLSGCKEVETETAAGYEPAHLKEVKGSKIDAKVVTFTAEGARRVGVETAPIRQDGGRTVIPYQALIYEPDGKTYVYEARKPREYLRAEIKVDRIDGDRVLASDGPAAGTQVVTVGAPEVYGTEQEIAGSH